MFLKTKSNYFESMKLLKFVTEIHFPNHIFANNSIIIFILYYTPEIIEQIIQVINLNFR
jgi:hypothetical protein